MKFSKLTRTFLAGLLLLLLVAGCGQPAENTPTPTENQAPVVTPETPTDTPETVAQPGVILLLASASADQAKVAEMQGLLQSAAAQRGMTFEQRDALTVESAPENVQLVVGLAPLEGFQALVDGLPQAQFVALGMSGLTPRENLSVLPTGGGSENQAFLAGYIAAVESAEYRVGIISTNSPEGQTYRDAFLNGTLYFCGTCLPIYPPWEIYPTYAEVAPGASVEQIQAAAAALQAKQVQIVHVDPSLESEQVLQMLGQAGFLIIGAGAPPSGLEGNWVATVLTQPGMGVGEVVESALSGQSSGFVSASLGISYTGVGESRISHYTEIIEMLESDAIDPVGRVN